MAQVETEQPIIWWKDIKLLTGVILVLLSIILGFYGKFVFIARFYKPFGAITGISIWVFSWILLFVGVFLVGWETIRLIQYKIHHHVKKTIKTTYHHAKQLPRKGYHYTKRLHKRSMDKLIEISKKVDDNIK